MPAGCPQEVHIQSQARACLGSPLPPCSELTLPLPLQQETGPQGSNTHLTPPLLPLARTISWGWLFGGVTAFCGLPAGHSDRGIRTPGSAPSLLSNTKCSALSKPPPISTEGRLRPMNEVLIRGTRCKIRLVEDCGHSPSLPPTRPAPSASALKAISPPLAKFFKLWELGAHSTQEAWPRMTITDREQLWY